MQYNGNSDGQDLVSLCDDLVNTNVITYPLQAKTRSANKWLKQIWSWILDSYGGWQFDDANQTGVPIVSQNLVAGQQDQVFPTGMLTIRGIEILPNTTSTVYQDLIPITEEELRVRMISEASLFTAPGVPIYYRPIGNVIRLYPSPVASITNGLRVYFDRGSISFASTDTTKMPGFASQFHEAVGYGMACDYAKRNSMDTYVTYTNDLEDFKRRIQDFYSYRYQQMFPNSMETRDETWDYL